MFAYHASGVVSAIVGPVTFTTAASDFALPAPVAAAAAAAAAAGVGAGLGGGAAATAGAFPVLEEEEGGEGDVVVEGRFSIRLLNSPTSSLLTPVVVSSSCKFAWRVGQGGMRVQGVEKARKMCGLMQRPRKHSRDLESWQAGSTGHYTCVFARV